MWGSCEPNVGRKFLPLPRRRTTAYAYMDRDSIILLFLETTNCLKVATYNNGRDSEYAGAFMAIEVYSGCDGAE